MIEQKSALITGINGQDGSYLAELLLNKNYIVHGLIRKSSQDSTKNIDHLLNNNKHSANINLHYGDLSESSNILGIINKTIPDEIYNLGAQSHVAVSFDIPEYTAEVDAVGPLRILESVRVLGLTNKTKVYQASTSELYGQVREIPQSESTPFYPRSPYGVAKLYAYWITINYRESYGMFACNGILFNHESPRRGSSFVTRKITLALSRINLGLQDCLYLGNVDALRDWGHARDYVEMQWRMLQQDKPQDYVISTGHQTSVRNFVELAAKKLHWGGIEWSGEGLNEVGRRLDNGKVVIKISSTFYRPAEVETLLGDSQKALKELGWEPKTNLEELVSDMIQSDQKLAQNELLLSGELKT